MYVPRRYEEKDEEKIVDFIKQNSFGILVTSNEGIPIATHIPFLIYKKQDQWYLSAHISKGNIQKNTLQQAQVLVIFTGPHAYISPTWYTELNVPTWNYIAVHVYGSVRIIEGKEMEDQLSQLVDEHEQFSALPMKMEDIPAKTFNDDIRGIVAFEIEISRFEAAYKLSQNRDELSYTSVIEHLNQGDASSQAVAKEMELRKQQHQ